MSSEAIYDYIRRARDDFDCFIFAPYLFGVTYYGLRIVPEKSIIVPCLHDEPYAYLKVIRDLFAEAAGVFFNSRPERDLARRLFDLEDRKTRIVGMGIDAKDSLDAKSFREKYKADYPYLLYAGRREDGKNTPLLIEYFRQFRRAQETDLRLLLIGTGELGLKRSDRGVIEDLGYLPEADKWNGYAASLALCQPSTNESFSIVLLESWLAGRPALVNAFCPVTLDHCRRSSGGLYFRDYFEFEECLLYLLENPGDANAMGKSGRRYVRDNFTWDDVLDRLEKGISQCLRH